MATAEIAEMELIQKLTKDLRAAAKTLNPDEARFLVDGYYQIQEMRKRFGNQIRASSEAGEPNELLDWLFNNSKTLEGNIKKALDVFTDESKVGSWMKSICGIGPVISAGLIAHIDITKAQTAGHIWSFAGLSPNQEWKKGEKRPWNARLKTLCWKIGESFVKVSGREKDFYGKLLLERKAQEIERNEAGEFAEQAAAKLERFKIGKSTDAYKSYSKGKLPPGHIHARAKRWAVKIFLSHVHWVMFEVHYGKRPPNPYVVEHLGHAHVIEPPNWPVS